MLPGAEPMGAPTSFTARRPNASNLPQFELPPPQLPSYTKHQHGYPGQHPSGISNSLTSVGNLLTPPSGSSSDGLSPTSTAPSQNMNAPYTPGPYTWGQNSNTTPLGFQTAMTPNAFHNSRGPFSPGLNSIGKQLNDNVHGDVQGYSMSAPVNLPSIPSQHHSNMGYNMNQGMTQASPMTSQDGFRPQSSSAPSQYNHSVSPAQTPMGYSNGPPQMQHSPMGVSSHMPRMSPAHQHGQIPPIHTQPHPQSPYNQQRPYSYPLPGPVLSNMGTPGGQMSLVGSMPSGMVGYNSGHLAQMPHLYGHGGQAVGPNSDRPFKCDQCPQSFNRNHDLKRHKRIHLAVKPFPCGHCDKSFSRKDALKRHILVKGCGKSGGHMGGDKHSSDGSLSPSVKSDMSNSSPVIAQSA